MRVFLDLAERAGEHFVVITAPGRPASERPVRWTAGQRLLVARDEQLGDAEAAELAAAVDASGARTADLERYGRLLFEAAFGEQTWRQLVTDAAAAPYLELAIRGPAESPSPHALRWEALHDGTAAVAARGTVIDPGSPRLLPVGIVRLVPPALPVIQNVPGWLPSVNRVPRVLYAIGSRLTDPRVRAGAEFMGILRHLERKGGSIQPRVLQSASAESLTRELERFEPDVLHVIGHGRPFPEEHCVKLQLRAETPAGGDDWLTAGQLLDVFAAADHMPKAVVLSACQTASAPPDAGRPDDPVNALPFAAGLVAGGVPIVVAMAGDISDTACRVFTRALTQAIGQGVPLADAVIRGRRAAFHERPDLDSADWVLPAVFLAERLPADIRLVDTAAIKAMRQRIFDLNLGWDPVFCGRGEFIDAMDRLLDGSDPLNVLRRLHAGPGQELRRPAAAAANWPPARCARAASPCCSARTTRTRRPTASGSPRTSATISPTSAPTWASRRRRAASSRWRNRGAKPLRSGGRDPRGPRRARGRPSGDRPSPRQPAAAGRAAVPPRRPVGRRHRPPGRPRRPARHARAAGSQPWRAIPSPSC